MLIIGSEARRFPVSEHVPDKLFVDVGVVGRGLDGYSRPLGTNAQSVRPAHEHGPCLRQTARLFFAVFPSVRAP